MTIPQPARGVAERQRKLSTGYSQFLCQTRGHPVDGLCIAGGKTGTIPNHEIRVPQYTLWHPSTPVILPNQI